MSTSSMLKQWSDDRARLLASALPSIGVIVLGRRRTFSAIRWRGELVVTSAEAIGGTDRVAIRFADAEADAEVLAADLSTDVAVLRTSQAGAGSGLVRAAATLRLGEAIVLIGRTLGGPAARWGNVQLAGPAWTSQRGGQIDQRLELEVGFAPSLEGAAVLDMEGALAAMAVPGPHGRVLGIPAATIESVLAKVAQHGRLPRPYLGLRLQPLWVDERERTRLGRRSRTIAAVGGVDRDSPAAEADIRLGDLLLTMDGEPVESVHHVALRVARISPGEIVALEVLRGGQPLVLHLRVGERPHAPGTCGSGQTPQT